jgi:chromosome segregation ATPase
MDNDKFQELVIQQFQVMSKQFQTMDKQFETIDKRFETITNKLQALEEGQARMESRISNLDEGQARLEKSHEMLATEVMALKSKTNEIDTKLIKLAIRVENEIVPRINALFEGNKLHTEQLTRIEEQVSKHDQYIWQRIK